MKSIHHRCLRSAAASALLLICILKLISLAYPEIYQTLLADWKDAGMTLEK